MELRIDPNITYALALEGGGAKGAWQIGAWRALREAGIRVNAVAGSSVGSLNGALIAMGDLEKAEEIWRNIRYSQVMDVDDDAMSALMSGDLGGGGWKEALGQLWAARRSGGFDVTDVKVMPTFCWRQPDVIQTLPALDFYDAPPGGMTDAIWQRLREAVDSLRKLIVDFPLIGSKG